MPVWFRTESFDLPLVRVRGFRRIDSEELDGIWDECSCRNRRGVYLLAMRVGPGMRPWYVGRTAGQTFKRRIHQHKEKFENIINRAGKGTPLLIFLVKEGKGSGTKAIRFLEEYIINESYKRNSELENEQGIREPYFAIHGLGWRDGKPTGRPTAALNDLRDALSL